MEPSSKFSVSLALKRRVDAFNSQVAGVLDNESKAIHHARVASRRLREVISGTALDRAESKSLCGQLREVTKDLGSVRELDVAWRLLDELQRDARYPRVAVDALSTAVARARTNARTQLRRTLEDRKLERLARHLSDTAAAVETVEAADGRAFRTTWRWVADARLVRRADALASAIEHAGTFYSAARLHDVRIAVKKFRYAFELASETRPIAGSARDISALKTTQELLGRLHDRAVLIVWTHSLQESAALELATWRSLSALGRELENDCRRLHARFMRRRSQVMAVATRMGSTRPLRHERAAS
jgi:CHAD domain-containing protein